MFVGKDRARMHIGETMIAMAICLMLGVVCLP